MKQRLWYGAGMLLIALCVIALSSLARLSGAFSLLASSIDSLPWATTTLYLLPTTALLQPGGTTSVDLNINTSVPINALGATITFPTSTLQVVGISKQKSFLDLWTEDTTIAEQDGEVHFSGGVTKKGGLMGTGTVLTITVKLIGNSAATLGLTDVQVYPSDASGKAIQTALRSTTLSIAAPMTPAAAGGSGSPASTISRYTSADFNGDGRVDVADLSVFMVRSLGGYDPRFDLNSDGVVGLTDLAILLARMSGH